MVQRGDYTETHTQSVNRVHRQPAADRKSIFSKRLKNKGFANKNYKKESIIDSGEDSIIDRLDLIPEEFDVEDQNNDVSVPVE